MALIAKHPNAKDAHPRSKRVRTVSMLPSLFTLGNLLCGFAAIYFAMRATFDVGAGVASSEALTLSSERWERLLPSFLSVGAGLVLLGMVFDMFDGVVARMTKSTTSFGGQLDSMADMVTSGVAPMTLMLAFMMKELKAVDISLSPFSGHFFGRLAWVSAVVYVACAAVRLARFNVEHARSDHDHNEFRGLPSPGAAGVVAALLICVEQAQLVGMGLERRLFLYAMPGVALVTGLLMVSPIRYHKIGALLRGRRPFGQLIIVIFLFVIFWVAKSVSLIVLALGYALSGPLMMLVRKPQAHGETHKSGASDLAINDETKQTG